jgi:anti-anti-sigma factor
MHRDQPHLSVERDFDRARIVLSGDLDLEASEEIEDLTDVIFSELTAVVEVDVEHVTFFGSRALNALLRLRTEVARHSGAEMRITRCTETTRRIFELTGVIELIALGPALAEPAMTLLDMPHVA